MRYLHHDFAEALFVWVKVLPIIISERGWGRENQRGRGGGGVRFIFLYHMGGSLLKYKMKGGGLHFFFIILRPIKAEK